MKLLAKIPPISVNGIKVQLPPQEIEFPYADVREDLFQDKDLSTLVELYSILHNKLDARIRKQCLTGDDKFKGSYLACEGVYTTLALLQSMEYMLKALVRDQELPGLSEDEKQFCFEKQPILAIKSYRSRHPELSLLECKNVVDDFRDANGLR